MKKLTSLALAMVSTMLLVTGATRAAEKFDPSAKGMTPMDAESVARSSTLPCENIPDRQQIQP